MKTEPEYNMPPTEAIATFHVRIFSVHDATWQGVVEANGTTYQFQSELQLLRWVMEQYPALRPQVSWSNEQGK